MWVGYFAGAAEMLTVDLRKFAVFLDRRNAMNLVEGTMLAIAVVGMIGGVWNRIQMRRGIGVRFIQYLGLTVLVPLITILSLEHRISKEMTGAIAAAAVGGVLAGIGKDEQ
jgi:hypothetical protein